MLKEIHLLLTYQCTFECDHCFLYSGPRAEGTMTLPQLRGVLDEARKIGSVDCIYFEGGEPFLYYRTMLAGIALAREMGFSVGIVTNAYWAISSEDARAWLRPLAALGLADLSVSDDDFHGGGAEGGNARRALAAADELGIANASICIQKPFVEAAPGEGLEKGAKVIGGGAMFKGRAADKLCDGLPRRAWQLLNSCPHEDFAAPARVHVDSYGQVHLCQGLSLGNMWRRPLSQLVLEYKAADHPICGPLHEGGPAQLARHYKLDHEAEYVDECHFCFMQRRALLDRFPEQLAPRQVYGLD